MVDENGQCPMMQTFISMQKAIDNGETNVKEITRVVVEIKDGNNGMMYKMEKIQDTQIAMAVADKEYKLALATTNKETKDMITASFQTMRDEKKEEQRQATIKQEKQDVEDKRVKDAQILEDKRLKEKKDEEDKKIKENNEKELKEAKIWKKRVLIGLGISIFLMLLSTIIGILVKYFPQLIGLPHEL